jgi:hypothetical protein
VDKNLKSNKNKSSKKSSKWQSLILSYQDSSLSVTQFCKNYNISKSSFYKWSRKLSLDVAVSKGKFIAVRQSENVGLLLDSGISSPIKISFSDISLELNQGCSLSELSQIISLLNVAQTQ